MKKLVLIALLVSLSAIAIFGAKLVVWTSEKQVPFMKKMGEQFTKKYGVTLDVQMVNFGDIKSKFLTAAQAGEGPDIFVLAHDNMGELVANGLVEPFEFSAIDRKNYYDVAIDAFTMNGKLYGIPYAIESILMFYNKDYIKDPPKTLEQLLKYQKDFTTKDTFGLLWDVNNLYFSYPFLSGFGGYVFKWDGKQYNVKDVGLANAGAIKGGNLIKTIIENGMPSSSNYGTMDSAFKDGLCAMIINGPWAIPDYNNAGINYGVWPLANIELEKGKSLKPFAGVQGFMVNAKSKNKALAKEFIINYISTAEGAYTIYKEDPRTPARKDVAEKVIASDETAKVFRDAAIGAEPMPNVLEMGNIWSVMNGEGLVNFTNGTLTPEQALKDAVSKILANLK
jgi:maltose/maltodextrin transport system substrate-binding protein